MGYWVASIILYVTVYTITRFVLKRRIRWYHAADVSAQDITLTSNVSMADALRYRECYELLLAYLVKFCVCVSLFFDIKYDN